MIDPVTNMKSRICLTAIAFLLFLAPLRADEIHLKDGKVIKGKIIQITPKNIEYDPEGPKVFDVYPRDQVSRIVFDDGRVVMFSQPEPAKKPEEPGKPREEKKEEIAKAPSLPTKDLFFELESGWNGYTGLFGLRIDKQIASPFSLNAGLGYGLWGWRLSGGTRFYTHYPYGLAFGLGAAYNTGSGSATTDTKLETIDENGITKEETVKLKLKPVTTINVTALYAWKLGGDSKIYIEFGAAFTTKKDPYTVEEGKKLSQKSKDTITVIQPGGIILSIGYAL